MKNLFNTNKRKIFKFKTIPLKNPINAILFKTKITDDLFENNFNLINETKSPKNKENMNNNELSTSHTINIDNKTLKEEIKKNFILKEEEEIIEEKKEENEEEEEGKEEKKTEDKKENARNFEIQIIIREKKEKNLIGRKKLNSDREGIHTKFSDDNLRRKSKYIIINELKEFINKKLEEKYEGDLGQGILIKKFYTLNHKQIANAIIEYNKDFLNRTLKDIFSENISTRYTNYPKEHNKKLIDKLLKENDDNKRIYFTNFFNLTFRQCLNHFVGNLEIPELEGLKTIDEILKNFDNDLLYKKHLDYYFKNFEKIINNKKSRNRKKNINNEKE